VAKPPKWFFWADIRLVGSGTLTPSQVNRQAKSKMTEAWKQWEGQVVRGKFHLCQYLGGSEHSAVFLTEDPERGLQKAAIKLVPADPENAELQFSHWKEAAELSHPHLIRLFQMGRCQLGNRDLVYLVMDYADVDLSQIFPHGPLPPEETRDTLKLILDVLAYLHGNGFIHGHLKPANIMGVDDQLKLSSDGLCRMGESRRGRGTPGVYDPPEAASGTNSPAGDVWSLGITLVEALTQRPPVWVGAEEGEPLLPQPLPAPFFEIARHCLLRDPQNRWTVDEIVARLEPASPVSLPPVTKPQINARPQKESVKWRHIIPAVAVGLALAVTLAELRLLNRHRVQPKPDQNPVTRSTGSLTQKTSEEQQSSSGTRPSTSSLRSGAGAKTPTGGGVQGGVRQKVLPNVPQSARETIRGTVRVSVKVAIDPSGKVVEATLDSPGPSPYFARLALQAARRWKFWPGEVDSRHASNKWVLQFKFERTATEAVPVHAVP
jgi:TonB family protein